MRVRDHSRCVRKVPCVEMRHSYHEGNNLLAPTLASAKKLATMHPTWVNPVPVLAGASFVSSHIRREYSAGGRYQGRARLVYNLFDDCARRVHAAELSHCVLRAMRECRRHLIWPAAGSKKSRDSGTHVGLDEVGGCLQGYRYRSGRGKILSRWWVGGLGWEGDRQGRKRVSGERGFGMAVALLLRNRCRRCDAARWEGGREEGKSADMKFGQHHDFGARWPDPGTQRHPPVLFR